VSQIADKVEEFLVDLFPTLPIRKEHFVVYKGQKLFVDFFIPSYLLAIEVHGEQHDRFVEHFHGGDRGWREHRSRDRLKAEWADVNNISYLVIRKRNMPKTKEDLLLLIMEVCDV
jgi:hypothetical protein